MENAVELARDLCGEGEGVDEGSIYGMELQAAGPAGKLILIVSLPSAPEYIPSLTLRRL